MGYMALGRKSLETPGLDDKFGVLPSTPPVHLKV